MLNIRVSTRTLRDAAAFVGIWDEIADLRESLGVWHDVLLNPLHFLTATDDTRRSCSVACYRGNFVSSAFCMRPSITYEASAPATQSAETSPVEVFCSALLRMKTLVLRESMKRMVADGIHSIHLRFLPKDDSRFGLRGLGLKFLDALIPGDRMELQPTFEEFLATLGKHTRRNIRACTRKTEAVRNRVRTFADEAGVWRSR